MYSVNIECSIGSWEHLSNTSLYIIRSFFMTLSTVICVASILRVRRCLMPRVDSFSSSKSLIGLRNKQLKMTVSAAIGCFLRLVLTILPTYCMLYWKLSSNPLMAKKYGFFFWILNCLNATTCLFVYTTRHQSLRSGLTYFFRPSVLSNEKHWVDSQCYINSVDW